MYEAVISRLGIVANKNPHRTTNTNKQYDEYGLLNSFFQNSMPPD